MNVLMLTCQYMPDVYGGAEKQCWRLSKALVRHGINIRLITSLQKNAARFDDDLPISRIYTGKAPDLLGRWFIFSSYWFFRVVIWGVIHRHSYDLVHCHQGKFGGFVGCFLGLLVKKPVLIKIGNSEQDMDFLCLKRKFFFGPLLFRFVLKRQPYVVAISQVIARNLETAGFKNIIRIPNGIDVNELASCEIAERPAVNSDRINLFYHGRVERIKRVHLLVDAMVCLKDSSVHLHIVGDGDELGYVKGRISDFGLEQQITVYGRVDNVLASINNWDIFVNASQSEGFSNSLLEALFLGKILVSTNVSGCSEAIEVGVNGYIAKSESAKDIAAAIQAAIELHCTARNKAKKESSRKVADVFDINLVAKRYIQLYEEIS
ncbi:MAG: glycosyltransferase [Cellvibrionaceae bacterium]|nr:glycosyltransferase [Cellvibrionaceae bacterium]